jgi:oxygen-independent coproporphyrinogen-3 oxidase
VYWRAEDYLGIGPGAHGRLTLQGAKWATRQHRAPEAWLQRVEEEGHATRTREALSPQQQAEEALLMGLRLAEGVPLASLEALALQPVKLAALEKEGLLRRDDARLVATPAGRQRLDAVLAYLV